MAGSYYEPRAAVLRSAFHGAFRGGELSAPIEAIAEDFPGLTIEEAPLVREAWAREPVSR